MDMLIGKEISIVMSEKQKRILNWLREVEPELGELYEGALRIIKDRSFQGCDRLICHAVREIRNRLPNAVAGKHVTEHLNYPEEVTSIKKAWDSAGLESVYENQSVKASDEPGQFVPREVLAVIDRLMKRHKEVKNRKEERARRLLIALEPENEQMKSSLTPVVEKWIDETEWFVERVHVGKAVDEDELITHFETFEIVLGTFAGYFYEGFEEIEQFVEKANKSGEKPSNDEVMAVVLRLVRAKYRIHFFNKLENPNWIEPLKNEGFLKSPVETKEGENYETWLEGRYLKKVASKVPDKVLEVISEIHSTNPFVQSTCIECLLEMPEDVAIKGIKVIENMLPRRIPERAWGRSWTWKKAAELMVKIVAKYEDESFKISWILLDAWISQESKGFKGISAKFTEHDYRELVLKYFSKLWEVNARKAIWVMVKILNRCLEELDKRDDYDVSSHFYISQALRNLDSIDMGHAEFKSILVKGICEAGKLLIKKQPKQISDLMEGFEKCNRAIFKRIEMYLLRFIESEVEKERINKIIEDKNYLGDPCYEYEYKLLLQDKFEEVEEARKVFEKWIEDQKIDDIEYWKEWFRRVNEREPNDEDVKKYIAGMKARELFLVKERYSKEFEKYKNESGLSYKDLAPRRMVGETRCVSPMEGTPLEPEVMGTMKTKTVLDYILEPKNYEGTMKTWDWQDPAEGLRATFKEDVKKRPIEYLKEGRETLANLPVVFLSKFFYGIYEAVRDGSFGKEGWSDLIGLAHEVVQGKHIEKEYKNCFSAILSTLRDGFTERDNAIEFDKKTIENMWAILEMLVTYDEDYETSNYERDPIQMRCTSVNGEALEQVVMLGIVCKRDFTEYYDKHLKSEIRKLLDYVVMDVKRPEVNCTLGIDFGRIGWIDEEWLRENIEKIFDGEMWDVVWGTHVAWERPSRPGFELLKERGIYENAISKLNTLNKYEFEKKPDEGFVEHLMIGYFNEWIEFEDELLKKLFEKATAELRGKAARFLTTGFKLVNEEGGEKEKIAKRMKEYWEKRLEAIREKPEENKDEAVEFTGWVEDSLLGPKETLELLDQTLELSGGEFGQMRDVSEFIKEICELGKGNELVALRCLKKATADENMRMPWARYDERLVEFLEQISELNNDYENVREILSEAIEADDLYGRLQPDKFREIWEKLNSRQRDITKVN